MRSQRHGGEEIEEHGIILANLAEEAAERIGADGLLARVGTYYHDIGKIDQAEYFIENQKDEYITIEVLQRFILDEFEEPIGDFFVHPLFIVGVLGPQFRDQRLKTFHLGHGFVALLSEGP